MAKRLVINADDFGLREDINSGIIKCYREGALTAMNLLAAGEFFEASVELARKNNINRIGVHLTLTGGLKPASPAETVPSLLGRKGTFPKGYAGFLAKFFTGRVKRDEIYREFKNQIFRVKKAGFEITHLNSHHHIHVVPEILKIVIKLMKEEGIEYVRFPLERVGLRAKLRDLRLLGRSVVLSFMCGLSGGMLRASGVKYNDHFVGHGRALRLKRKDFISAISGLRDGLTELGCHPVSSAEELDVLCDPGFAEEIKARSVELVSY